MSAHGMPPLPSTAMEARLVAGMGTRLFYSADQMHAYARAYAAEQVRELVEALESFVDFPESTFDGDEDGGFTMTVRLNSMRAARALIAKHKGKA